MKLVAMLAKTEYMVRKRVVQALLYDVNAASHDVVVILWRQVASFIECSLFLSRLLVPFMKFMHVLICVGYIGSKPSYFSFLNGNL